MMGPLQLLKKAALMPLRFAPVRSRLAFWLNQEHYPELEIRVPLSHNLVCPIFSPEYWCSFSEIFINAEYHDAFQRIPLPNRWLDLGCHAGFFSLYVEWLRRKSGIVSKAEALLVDADRRSESAVTQINNANDLSFRFAHGGIGANSGAMQFTERAFMASSAAAIDSSRGAVSLVPTLTAETLSASLTGPYDIIKVDIEGSEFDLVKHYEPLLKQSRYLILEWHSWHSGGGGKSQLIECARAMGFELESEIRPDHEVAAGKQCGVLLLENISLSSRRVAI